METQKQTWNVDTYLKNADFVPAYGKDLIRLLSPRQSDVVLDLGCGDGSLTCELQATGCRVVAVDKSPAMIDKAKARGLLAQVLAAEDIDFGAEFDAVFSNAVLHWTEDKDLVAQNVARALKPRGVFVGEFGGHGNVGLICTALHIAFTEHGYKRPTPWYFVDDHTFSHSLKRAGFEVDYITLFARRIPLPTNMEGWLNTFAGSMFVGIPVNTQEQILAHALAIMAPHLKDSQGNWFADYVRLQFRAVLN